MEKAKNKTEAKNNLIFALRDMQRFIIGYLYIHGEWIPAISETEAFQPLSSFGSSNDHIYDAEFKQFPDDKTMADMKPIELHEWRIDNLT